MPQFSTTRSWYRSAISASGTSSPVSASYQPADGVVSHTTSPVFQASSRTPAAESSSSTSISKRVREEPNGPSSPAPTMTTRSSGAAVTPDQAGATDAETRGGAGRAAMVSRASAISSASAAAAAAS